MKRPEDLTDIFREWEYDEEDNVRFLTGDDGREIMQIRQPLGIEQYDLDGRPDGRRPDGAVTFLELYRGSIDTAEAAGDRLELQDRDFENLQNEGILYYQRYLALFQVGFYDRVARDTEHNLEICSILEVHYPSDRRYEILQYRPYIRRMNAISRAMMKLADDENTQAARELEKGREDIEALPTVPTPIFECEKIRSLQHLSQVLTQVNESVEEEHNAKGFRERLTEELAKAVDSEDYERAARLRDRIRRLD